MSATPKQALAPHQPASPPLIGDGTDPKSVDTADGFVVLRAVVPVELDGTPLALRREVKGEAAACRDVPVERGLSGISVHRGRSIEVERPHRGIQSVTTEVS